MEYIYKLILEDRLFNEENWTEEDEKIVSDHFNNLLNLKKQNRLVLAGKTDGLDTNTYGIVIFTAESDEEAKTFMENDPAVKQGIMTGYLQRYNVALISEDYIK